MLRFKHLIYRISSIGIDKEKDVTLHDYIVYSNLLAFTNSLALFSVSILLFFFINNPFCAFCCLFASFIQYGVLFFNSIGKSLIARLHLFIVNGYLLLIYSIIFSHKTTLDTYFIIVCMAPVLMFSANERKWLVFTYLISFINLIIEFTPLENYLPNYHLLNETPMVDYSVLLGLILMILNQVGIYAFIQRRIQRRLIAANNNLEHAHSELENYSKDLEIFGLTATHDLKAPISIARMFTQIIERSLKNETINREKISDSINTITASYNQMETLIDTYLAYIRTLQLSAIKENFFAKIELEIIAHNLSNIYKNAKIILPKNDIVLLANKLYFKTIMQNLIQNGLKYNKSTIPIVTVEIVKQQNTIQFKIIDNGLGIDDSFKDELFFPFKRFHTDIDGTGLGLTISKRAAQKMNGNLICAESNHAGTTFILEIPA